MSDSHDHCQHHGHGEQSHAGTVKDPVCGMTVDPARTAHHAEHAGHEYHFCSAGCRTKFIADPAQYGRPVPAPARSAAWRWNPR